MEYALETGFRWLFHSVSLLSSGTWQVIKYTHSRIFEEEETEPESASLQDMVDREKEFHNYVRHLIICLWLFMLLYLFAYWIITKIKRKVEKEALYAGEEDCFVYRVSVWISSIATATSIGSLFLLPFSVIGVELLQLYDGNYYLQWLSYMLIGALWHYVFMLSNLSLFVLLPFSYFFIESQGFSTSKTGNGITQRIYEAMAISFLFAFVLLCLAEVVLTIFDYPVSFLSITSVNLPLIYSCVSFSGALLLLISTPYGFARMFSLAREFFTRETVENAGRKVSSSRSESPIFSEENEEELEDFTVFDSRKDWDSGVELGYWEEPNGRKAKMDLDGAGDGHRAIRRRHRKREAASGSNRHKLHLDYEKMDNFDRFVYNNWESAASAAGDTAFPTPSTSEDSFVAGDHDSSSCSSSPSKIQQSTATWKSVMVFRTVRESILYQKAVEQRGRLMKLFDGLKLPIVATILLVLTVCALAMVAINTLKLAFGYRSLPVYVQFIEVHTRHSFGLFGACIETIIIIYVMLTSFVGLYSLPMIRSLRPVRRDTPMPTIIINSSIVLVVASALPVIVNTVGMTTFDLLGAHSALQWLGSFRVVLAYNSMFFVLSLGLLFRQLTASMREKMRKMFESCASSCRKGSTDEADADETIVILRGSKLEK